jgi:quinolinate synthase
VKERKDFFVMNDLQNRIRQLKEEKNAVILAHYYVHDDVQEAADYIGDSFYLSKIAAKTDADIIVFCGVSFMGESAKILNPEKTVLMPDETADCPMAHMAEINRIDELREKYEDLAVVCYINSTAELKQHSDVCVTSSNALKIVKKLPNKHIFFIPDENLGRYIASLVPEKEFIFNDGYCHVHAAISAEQVKAAKASHPEAEFLVHPECKPEILALADFIGSTSEIIDHAGASTAKEFIIGTELGVLYELKRQNPDKTFYSAGSAQCCPNMKKISLEKIIHVLETGENEVHVSDELRANANAPLEKMLQLAK